MPCGRVVPSQAIYACRSKNNPTYNSITYFSRRSDGYCQKERGNNKSPDGHYLGYVLRLFEENVVMLENH
jgi:hypothetical protein